MSQPHTPAIEAAPAADAVPAGPLPTHGSAGRVEMVDAVRGLACLWVLFHHSFLHWNWRVHWPVLQRLNHYSALGFLGVHLFLVISGFVLFLPVVRRHGTRHARVDVPTFLYRRARRILPPYYVALAICMVLSTLPLAIQPPLGDVRNVTSDVLHALMLHNLHPGSMGMFNGAFWSLALEWQLYLLFPVLLWGCRQVGLRWTVGLTLVAAVAWQTVVCPRAPHLRGVSADDQLWPDQAAWYYAVPGRCFEFAMGMLAAAAVARPRRGQTAAAVVVVLAVAPVAYRLVSRHGQFGPARDQLWGVTFAATLVLAAATPAWLANLGVARITAWFGGISYSVYLIHEPLLQLAALALNHWHVAWHHRLPVFLVAALPALVGLGFAYHVIVERPFMSAKRPPLLPDAAPAPSASTAGAVLHPTTA